MNQAHQMDVFTFYEKGILQSIMFGERLFFTSEKNLETAPRFFEKMQTCNKQFFLMGIERQKCETERKNRQTLNNQRIRTGNGLTISRGKAYFNTE
jgi:hypothetical protein